MCQKVEEERKGEERKGEKIFEKSFCLENGKVMVTSVLTMFSNSELLVSVAHMLNLLAATYRSP